MPVRLAAFPRRERNRASPIGILSPIRPVTNSQYGPIVMFVPIDEHQPDHAIVVARFLRVGRGRLPCLRGAELDWNVGDICNVSGLVATNRSVNNHQTLIPFSRKIPTHGQPWRSGKT